MAMLTQDEGVLIKGSHVDSGKAFYNVIWTEQGGLQHSVWRRYSEFDKLRKALTKEDKTGMVESLPFPKKTKMRKTGSKDGVVEERTVRTRSMLSFICTDCHASDCHAYLIDCYWIYCRTCWKGF